MIEKNMFSALIYAIIFPLTVKIVPTFVFRHYFENWKRIVALVVLSFAVRFTVGMLLDWTKEKLQRN